LVFGFDLLSVVGAVASAEINTRVECGGDSSGFETYVQTFRLKPRGTTVPTSRKTDSFGPANLLSIYPENQILESLLRSPEIQRTLEVVGGQRKVPESLRQLQVMIKQTGADGIDSSGHVILPESFQKFYFDHIEGDRVIVMIELSGGGGARDHPRLALDLPIPYKLERDLHSAASLVNGFLNNESATVSHEMETEIRSSLNSQ
jgi:hypothetical protein